MKHKLQTLNGEGEIFKESAHAAYCRYLINVYEDEKGTVTKDGTMIISREGLTADTYKKISLNFVFHRADPHRLVTAGGETYNLAFSEFNAFSGEGIFKVQP